MKIKRLLIVPAVLALVSGLAVTSTAKPAAAAGFGVPTTVNSSNNPSNLGQSVTFTATVTAPLAFGDVVFFDGLSPMNLVAVLTPNFGGFCDCIPDGTSSASFSTSSLSSGTHLITAAAGGTPFGTSLSDPIVQTVQGATTTTTVTAAPSPPTVFGQGVTFTAVVVANPSSVGTPTGSVQFTDNGADFGGSETLSAGTASASFPSLSVGAHSVVATYSSDDATFLGSSGSISQPVVMASTLTALASTASPSVFGQPITLTASVGPMAPGAGTPTGTVTFADGAANLGVANLAGGQATISLAGLSVGSHNLTAAYSGDTNFKTSSAMLTQTVNQAPTGTAVSSSANPSVFGQSVRFTATVCPLPPSANPSQPPSGTVVFTVDGGATPLDTETLSATSAPPGCQSATSNPVGSLSVATHPISASYQGDGDFLASSGGLNGGQVVNKAPTATNLSASPNPSFFGDGVTLTATVTVPAPGAGTPTGTVTFTDGATVLGTSPLGLSGHATLTTAGLQVGTHSLQATYGGDGNFLASTSNSQLQMVRCLTVLTGKVNGGLIVSGSTCVNNATVNGGITVLPGAALSLNNSTVNGGIGSSGAKAVTLCTNSVNGAGTVSTTSGFVLIGDNGDDGFSCGGNSLRGNLTLSANAGQLELGGNQIHGGASITSTSGSGPTIENAATEIEGNQISGQLSCTKNTPAPIDDGSPNPSTGGGVEQCAALVS